MRTGLVSPLCPASRATLGQCGQGSATAPAQAALGWGQLPAQLPGLSQALHSSTGTASTSCTAQGSRRG